MKHYFSEVEYEKADFLTGCEMRDTERLLNSMPENPQWVQLRDEYGDVWHKIEDISINKESPLHSYCMLFDKNIHNRMKYFDKIRLFATELPEDAHIVIVSNDEVIHL